MKKWIALLLTVVTLLAVTVPILAAGEVTVTLNGVKLEFDVPAQVINNRTMVPMRKIFESLGASVDWVESEKGIVATRDSLIIVMKIGSPLMLVTDVSTGVENRLTLDVPPCIVNNRTLVPLRAISESFGVQVEWNGETRTVLLTTAAAPAQAPAQTPAQTPAETPAQMPSSTTFDPPADPLFVPANG